MKFIAACLMVAVAAAKNTALSRIGFLKKSVTEEADKAGSMFGLSGFEDKKNGQLSVSMSLKPAGTSSVENLVAGAWLEVEASSPLKALGFEKWQPVKAGIAFQSTEGTQTRCTAAAGESVEQALVVHFACKDAASLKPRFSQVKHADSDSAFNEVNSGDVPFGWNTQWGEWDYPFYSVTTQGILGCRTTAAAYCTPQNADLFPFEPVFDWTNYLRAASPPPGTAHKEFVEGQ